MKTALISRMIFYNNFSSLLLILNGTLKKVESFSHSDIWTSAEPLSYPFERLNII